MSRTPIRHNTRSDYSATMRTASDKDRKATESLSRTFGSSATKMNETFHSNMLSKGPPKPSPPQPKMEYLSTYPNLPQIASAVPRSAVSSARQHTRSQSTARTPTSYATTSFTSPTQPYYDPYLSFNGVSPRLDVPMSSRSRPSSARSMASSIASTHISTGSSEWTGISSMLSQPSPRLNSSPATSSPLLQAQLVDMHLSPSSQPAEPFYPPTLADRGRMSGGSRSATPTQFYSAESSARGTTPRSVSKPKQPLAATGGGWDRRDSTASLLGEQSVTLQITPSSTTMSDPLSQSALADSSLSLMSASSAALAAAARGRSPSSLGLNVTAPSSVGLARSERPASGRSLSIATARAEPRGARAGRVGLTNYSNSCFMNSTLQCLGHTPGLYDWFLNNSLQVSRNSRTVGEFANAFQKAMHCMWKKDHSHFEPIELKSALRRWARRFSGDTQQDAQEFLRYLLDSLHEDLNERPKVAYEELKDVHNESVHSKAERYWRHYSERNDSLLSRLFCGQLKSTVLCLKCRNESITFDPFMDLSLPIPQGKYTGLTISHCLELFTDEERLDGDNMVYCSKCKDHRPCTKRMTVYKLPQILVLHIKRFEYNSYLGTKLTDPVRYPARGLDISPFLDPTSSLSKKGPQTYNLFGVVHHVGSLRSGHYFAHCQESSSWFEFNDSTVRELGQPENDAKSAYILFYCKSGPAQSIS